MSEDLEGNIDARIVVLGIGNELLRDEGVGVHVARALEKKSPPEGIDFEVIDGGTSPDAFNLPGTVSKLIIVDAAKGEDEPGTVYRFAPEEIEPQPMTSLHQLGVLESLKLMSLSGHKPGQTVIIGVEPKEIDWGTELSPELERRIPRIVEVVLEEVSRSK